MTNQEREAQFDVVWNGSVIPGTDADLFRKPTIEEQKQPEGFEADHRPWKFSEVKAKGRGRDAKPRKKTRERFSAHFRELWEAVA